MAVILKNLIKRSILTIPVFIVSNICRIAKRSGLDDDKDLFLLIAMCRFKFRPCGNVPLQIPTFLYVPDICKIAKQSGLNDGEDFIFTNSNVPPQIPTLRRVAADCSDLAAMCRFKFRPFYRLRIYAG